MDRGLESAPARFAALEDDDLRPDAGVLVKRAAGHADRPVGRGDRRGAAAGSAVAAEIAGRGLEGRDPILSGQPPEGPSAHLIVDPVLAARHLSARLAVAAHYGDDARRVHLERDRSAQT